MKLNWKYTTLPPKIKPRILRVRSATVNRNKLKRQTKYGAGDRSRTRDILITSEALYQLSYSGNFNQLARCAYSARVRGGQF